MKTYRLGSASGDTEYLPLYGDRAPHGISWGRTLKFCKAACEQINDREMAK